MEPEYYEYPLPLTGFPWGKFLIITAIVIVVIIILISLLAIGWVWIAPMFRKTYGVPILDIMNLVPFENMDPPYFVNHFTVVPYTLDVKSYDAASGTGTATLAWLEDLGLSEGIAVALGDFTITDSGWGMTFENFTYIEYVGREVSNMPEGPFYLSIITEDPPVVELTGHYEGITETLQYTL